MLKRISTLLPLLFVLALMARSEDLGLPGLPPLPGDNSSATPALGTLPGQSIDQDQPPADPKARKQWEKKKEKEKKDAEKKAKEEIKKLLKLNEDRQKQGLGPLNALPGSETSASTGQSSLPGESVLATAGLSINQDQPPADPKERKKWEKKREQKKKDDAKQLEKLNKQRKKQGMDPLAALPGSEQPTTSSEATSTALPALPGEGTASALNPVSGDTPAEAEGATDSAKAKGKKVVVKKWKQPDFGPNVIFGGWVRAKGADLDERLAWASQEVLNTLDFNGYDFDRETGAYKGQNVEKQWREFSFKPRNAKKSGPHPVTVFVEPGTGDKVWMRVGPFEPPAGVPAKTVKKMRETNQKVLKLLQKKLGLRFTPARKGFEAPYRRSKA